MVFRKASLASSVLLITASALALTLYGCATSGGVNNPLALIEIERKQQTSSGDCPISVKIFNRFKGVAWDGVSYHLALRDKSGAAVGELQGIPLRYTEPGYGLIVSTQAHGVKCEEIAGVSLLYFGYYPTGRGQVRLSNNAVTTQLR